MARDKNREMFNRGVRLFPIHHQAEINLAALYFRRLEPSHRFYNRACAWLGYTALTVDADDFGRGNNRCWGFLSRSSIPDNRQFLDRATRLAEQARTSEKGDFLYDCCWALAYIYLMQSSFQAAEDELEIALRANDLGNGSYRDPNLLMDGADFVVHLGRLTPMVGPNGPLKSARQLLQDAHRAVPTTSDRPDWWVWVEAWVTFAEAVQTPPLNGSTLAASKALVESIVDPNARDLDQEYDAWALLAVLRELSSDHGGAQAAWAGLTQQKQEDREDSTYQWTKAKEKRRNPFWVNRPAASAVRAAYYGALNQI